MKRTNKLLAAVLSVVMMAAMLTACGSSGGSSGGASGGSQNNYEQMYIDAMNRVMSGYSGWETKGNSLREEAEAQLNTALAHKDASGKVAIQYAMTVYPEQSGEQMVTMVVYSEIIQTPLNQVDPDTIEELINSGFIDSDLIGIDSVLPSDASILTHVILLSVPKAQMGEAFSNANINNFFPIETRESLKDCTAFGIAIKESGDYYYMAMAVKASST
ncbi:MAG: hypothetical protein ACI4JC_04405 [Faecalibacterium sp.]